MCPCIFISQTGPVSNWPSAIPESAIPIGHPSSLTKHFPLVIQVPELAPFSLVSQALEPALFALVVLSILIFLLPLKGFLVLFTPSCWFGEGCLVTLHFTSPSLRKHVPMLSFIVLCSIIWSFGLSSKVLLLMAPNLLLVRVVCCSWSVLVKKIFELA